MTKTEPAGREPVQADIESEMQKALDALPFGIWRVIHSSQKIHGLSAYVTAAPYGWSPDPMVAYTATGIWSHAGVTSEECANFIALSRQFVPWVLQELAALRAQLAEITAERDWTNEAHADAVIDLADAQLAQPRGVPWKRCVDILTSYASLLRGESDGPIRAIYDSFRADVEAAMNGVSQPRGVADERLTIEIKKRDDEWTDAIWPGNVNTMIGQTFGTPEGYRHFRIAEDSNRHDDLRWFAENRKRMRKRLRELKAELAALRELQRPGDNPLAVEVERLSRGRLVAERAASDARQERDEARANALDEFQRKNKWKERCKKAERGLAEVDKEAGQRGEFTLSTMVRSLRQAKERYFELYKEEEKKFAAERTLREAAEKDRELFRAAMQRNAGEAHRLEQQLATVTAEKDEWKAACHVQSSNA